MKYISDKEKQLANNFVIGGKAKNLFRLGGIGVNVPQFVVIPQEVLVSLVPEEIQNSDYKRIIEFIQHIPIPEKFLNDILAEFPSTNYFAVRSSAIDEDGSDFSFAGQF